MFSAIRARLTLRSVRARLTFWYLLTLGASLAGFAAFLFVVRAHAVYRELDANLEVRARQLAFDLRVPILSLDVADALAADPRAIDAPVLVRRLPGPILFRSPSFPVLPFDGERVLMAAGRAPGPLVTVSDWDGIPYRVASVAVERPGTEGLALQVATSMTDAALALRQLAGVMIAAIFVVLALASYGSGFTARRALAPVDEIVTRVRAIQADQPGARLDVHAGSEELDRLVSTLNGMLDRIDTSMRGTRRFAADASHELQTPLAAMRNVVDTCVRRARGPEDYHEMAAGVLAEIDRLSALIRDLRLLALADAGRLLDERTEVDLSLLTVECCEIAQAIAEEEEIQVRTAVAPVMVQGSPLHLRRAVLNLVQNAIRYSPPSSNIDVRLQQQNGHGVLSVADSGCGIPASDLQHIFERFFRADPARARETGGSGLGLAIVDEIVRAHHGRIDVVSTPGRGSIFTMYLPVSRATTAPATRI